MKKHISIVKIVTLVILSAFLLSGCVSKSEHEEAINQVSELTLKYEELVAEVTEIKSERDSIKEEANIIKANRDDLSNKVDSLKKELDDIKNGPTNLLSQARRFFEEENYNKAIEITSTLHNKFNGIPEDIEGQKLAKDAQNKIDEQIRLRKEEEERIAAEKLKSEKDKAREIIRVTKVSKSRPNSAGGVDLFIGYKNMSDKVIKYATFTIVPYNKVGDLATCDIRGYSTYRAQDEGPHKKGQGIAGDYNWYWENAWYNWTIDRLELREIHILYMDGSSITLTGEDLNHVRY